MKGGGKAAEPGGPETKPKQCKAVFFEKREFLAMWVRRKCAETPLVNTAKTRTWRGERWIRKRAFRTTT